MGSSFFRGSIAMLQGVRKWVLVALALVGSVNVGRAATIVMNFEGLQNNELINNYYNGGFGGSGSGPGPSFGITFTGNSRAYKDSDAGGTGNFGFEPSPSNVALFQPGGFDRMNIPAGFTTAISFYYVSIFAPASITVWDNINGTGTLLATIILPQTTAGPGDPTGLQSPFVPFGATFSGTARSVDFTGAINKAGFDNLTLGSVVPQGPIAAVPLPAAAWAGLALLGALFIRRRLTKT
jgi:hypothetical protein